MNETTEWWHEWLMSRPTLADTEKAKQDMERDLQGFDDLEDAMLLGIGYTQEQIDEWRAGRRWAPLLEEF